MVHRGATVALDAQTISVAGVVLGGGVVLALQRAKARRGPAAVALLAPAMVSALVTASAEGGVYSQTAIWLPIILFVVYAVGGVVAGRSVGGVALVGFTALVWTFPAAAHGHP